MASTSEGRCLKCIFWTPFWDGYHRRTSRTPPRQPSQIKPGALYCPKCGRRVFSSGARIGIFFAIYFGLAMLFVISSALWNEHVFTTMSPAQHLAEAKKALRDESGAFDDEGLRHANAVPANSPEAQEATEAATTLGARLEEKKRADVEAQQIAADARSARAAAVRELQEQLRNLGYELTVAQSEKADEIIITSRDFAETDHRVRFLSFIRGRNSPAAGVCFAGFQSLLLRNSRYTFGGQFGFSESYPLECSLR